MDSLRQETALDGFEISLEGQEAGSSIEPEVARSFLGILLGVGLGLCSWTALYLLALVAMS